jgi:hypothetical protein
MVHMDAFGHVETTTPIQEFLATWEVFNNNEYFLKQLRCINIIDEVESCGFDRDKIAFKQTPYMTGTRATNEGAAGYMMGFWDVNVLVAEK